MLENEKQRRWWFANHPEYSNSRKRARDNQDDDGHDDQETVSPESVDAYVDEALKHVRGTVAALLKSFKRNFGTQAEDQQNKAKTAAPTSVDQTSHAKYRVSGLRKYSNEELRRMGIPTPEEQALVSDPHTFLDVTPYKRYITSPVRSLKGLFSLSATDSILYAAKKRGNKSASRKLARNLENSNQPRPSVDYDAHHLVPSGHRRAERARDILAQRDIRINEVENGMWLERSFHQTLSNSHKYMDRVTRMLESAQRREEALDILEQVRDSLSNKKIP